MKDKKALYLCQCFSSTYLFNQREQTKSDDSSWILHASAQAYRRRTDHRSLDRHSSVSSTWILSIWMRWVTCAGKTDHRDHGKTQQHYFL